MQCPELDASRDSSLELSESTGNESLEADFDISVLWSENDPLGAEEHGVRHGSPRATSPSLVNASYTEVCGLGMAA